MDARPLKPLRIDVFTDYYTPHVGGGVERVVEEVCQRLASQGHLVRVFTLNTAAAPPHEVIAGVDVYRAPAIQLTGLVRMQSSISPGMLPLVWRLARRDPPDVLHAHNLFFSSTAVAVMLRRLLKIPLVTTLHLGSLRHLGGPSQLLASCYERTIGRAIIHSCDRLIAVSEAVAKHALSLGARPEAVRVIANGVDPSKFQPDPQRRNGASENGTFRIACVGRLIFNKGPQFLIEAAPRILKARPDAEFVFVGDGPLRAGLEERTRELGIGHRARFLGTQPDVAAILQGCDLLVRPSLLEGMPLAILEAMACGLPVIATPVSGSAELVRHGQNGLLILTTDPNSLAGAVLKLMENEPLRRAQGRMGRWLAEHGHSWDVVARRHLSVYSELLSPATAEGSGAAEALERAA
jgi:glycosyltransferase involved in cell wall biosynthesis